MKVSRNNLIKKKCLTKCSTKIDEELKKKSRTYLNVLIMILINVIYCLEKVVIFISIGMNEKSLMEHHCLK